jgi:hypothetical protein
MAGVWDFLPLFAVLGNDAERAHHLSYHQALGPAPCQFSLVQFTSDSPRAHHLSYHQALGPHVSLSPPLPPSPQHAPLADESCVSDSISLPPPPRLLCVCMCVVAYFLWSPPFKKKMREQFMRGEYKLKKKGQQTEVYFYITAGACTLFFLYFFSLVSTYVLYLTHTYHYKLPPYIIFFPFFF